MNKEIRTILKKTVKVAGVTCVAAGAVAVMTSGVALKAITEGGKYVADAVKRIIDDKDVVDTDIIKEAMAEIVEKEAPVAAEKADFRTDKNQKEA